MGIKRASRGFAAIALVAAIAIVGGVPAAASAQDSNPGDTPARGVVSNMGLCSSFLGQLGVRSDVNHLLKELGPFLPDGPFNSPGELYRIRASQHPNASAEEECVQRPPA